MIKPVRIGLIGAGGFSPCQLRAIEIHAAATGATRLVAFFPEGGAQ
jgi:hypothetical protein